MSQFKPTENILILDVGASNQEYRDTANILEKKYPYPQNITELGVDDCKDFQVKYPDVRSVTYKGGEAFPL